MEATLTTPAVKVKKTRGMWYIGRRDNPQLSKPYFMSYGQLSKADAKKKEKCSYGSMWLTAYASEEEYNAALVEIKEKGFRIA